MTRRTLTLLIALLGAAGCTPTYRVHVNTFSQLQEPLNKGAGIYVAVDPNSRNPILANKIAGKMRTMLQDLGYNVAEEPQAAQYTATFRAGVNSSSYLDYLPVSQPFGGYYGFYSGFGRGFYPGFGLGYTYLPYIETVYAHWLDMRLYGQSDIIKGKTQPVWIGESVVGTDDPELRAAISYLLVGLMDYFGEDTDHWVTVKLKRDNPRVLAVTQMQ